jgi:23S rRNA G2445 N2-methylase RlmL
LGDGKLARPLEAASIAAGSGIAAPPIIQVLRVELRRNRCAVILSLAGHPLYRRGYRAGLGSRAPLREDIAAAACRLFLDHARTCCRQEDKAWSEPDSVMLPFAGSGTLAFELFLVSRRLPNCLFARPYAFESWLCHRPRATAWLRKRLVAEAGHSLAARGPLRVVALDRSEQEVVACQSNIERFGQALLAIPQGGGAFQAETRVGDFWQADLAELLPEGTGHVVLPLNPPYGRRLARSSLDVPRFYHALGRQVTNLAEAVRVGRALLSGCTLCPDEPAWRGFLAGLQHIRQRTYHFTQGGLDVRLCVFACF